LAPSQRQNYRRQWKLLEKQFEVREIVVEDDLEAPQAFANFQTAHERQWKSERKLGHFGDWPDSAEFNAELVETLSKFALLRIIQLTANGEIVSYQYGFVYGRRFFWRLPARAMEPSFKTYGLGVLGLVRMIEILIGEGVREIEGGVGHYDYKSRFGATELQTQSIVISSVRAWSKNRVLLFLKLAGWLHLIYYRIWRGRALRYLPFRAGRLWRIWIRSRI
jgi:CelD/BcsL family acetyltransferase involved in cellulose biosynthesis